MIRAAKIKPTVIWLLNLLTFLAATFVLYGFCRFFYKSPQGYKHIGDIFLTIVVLALNGGIVWQTGRWLIFRPSQIEAYGLLAFWIF
jgi:hypothetical protein